MLCAPWASSTISAPTVKRLQRLFEHPWAYKLIQAPWADAKLAPLLRHNDLERARDVLDVGCGPGTNAGFFARQRYVGLDINPAYIADARRRHAGEFVVADATTWRPADGRRYDLVLLNSFLHHVDDAAVRALLENLGAALSAEGRLHLVDLVLPARVSVAWVLGKLDRGDYPRPLEHWRALVRERFEPEVEEPYRLRAGPLTLWNMIYFKLRPRT